MESAVLTLESYAREGVDEYCLKTKAPGCGNVSLTFYPTLTAFVEFRPGNSENPIVLEEKGEALILHLCRELLRSGFLRHFLAVAFLDGRNLSAGRELKDQRWRRHVDLLREDQALLEEMAQVPLEKGSHPFSALLA